MNRVIELKTKIEDPKAQQRIRHHFAAVRSLYNEVACWGNDFVYTGEGERRSLLDQRLGLYLETNQSLSYERFSLLLRALYLYMVYAKKPTGVTTSLFGGRRLKERMEERDWSDLALLCDNYVEAEYLEKFLNKVPTELENLNFYEGRPYVQVTLKGSERYSVAGNVSRQLKAWIEQDLSARESYAKEAEDISNKLSKYSEEQQGAILEFKEFCSKNRLIRKFAEKAASYLESCLLPSLKEGVKPKREFYLDQQGKQRKYSLQGVWEYLVEHPLLWESEDLLKEVADLLIAISDHEKHKNHANYPFIGSADYHRAQYLLGSNFTPYKIDSLGEDLGSREFAVSQKWNKEEGKYENIYAEGVEGRRVEKLLLGFRGLEREEFKAEVFFGKKYHNGSFHPNSYFKNLQHWIGGKSSILRNNNFFVFNRHGKEVECVVKEPSIIYKGEGKGYFLRLNMSIFDRQEEVSRGIDMFKAFSTALPVKKTPKSKLVDRAEESVNVFKGKTGRYLGIDLGQLTPYHYVIGDFVVGKDASPESIKIIEEGEYLRSESTNTRYKKLLDEMYAVGRICGKLKPQKDGETPVLADGESAFIEKSLKDLSTYDSKYGQAAKDMLFKSGHEIFESSLYLAKNTDLRTLKRSHRWIVSLLFKYISLQFGKHKENRRLHLKNSDVESKWAAELNWILCIEKYKSLIKQVSYMGEEAVEKGSLNLDSFNQYHKGVKSNFLKIIAGSIVKTAVKNNCEAIAMEKLNGNNKALNSKKSNAMLSTWSAKAIQDAVKNAAEWHNIPVILVDEYDTSQVHYETGLYGYRDGERLYFEGTTGKIEHVHADKNAAKNILLRMLSRHGSLSSFNPSRLVEEPKPKKKKEENKESKAEKQKAKPERDLIGVTLGGYLTKHFGSIAEAREVLKKDFVDKNGKLTTNRVFWNSKTKKWITREEKNALVKKIKDIVELREAQCDEKGGTLSRVGNQQVA